MNNTIIDGPFSEDLPQRCFRVHPLPDGLHPVFPKREADLKNKGQHPNHCEHSIKLSVHDLELA